MFEALPPPTPLSRPTCNWIEGLPNEILSEIFLCVHDMIGDEMDQELVGSPPCTFLSHVCQRWRDVAISCQQLWSQLPRDTHEWTTTCLARAYSCPVELRLDVWQPSLRQQGMRQMILPAIPRARTLIIYTEPDPDEDSTEDAKVIFEGLAAQEVPLLEELKILLDPHFEWSEFTAVLAPLKNKTLPKLRIIELERCLLVPPHAIFSSSLTDITLSDTCIWSEVDDIIEFFELVPLLESFTYAYPSNYNFHGFSTEPSQRYPLRNVSLPKLEYFNVDASFAVFLCIFSHLVIPVDAQLYVLLRDSESSSLDRYTPNELEQLIARASAAMYAHYRKDIDEGRYYKAVEISHSSISARGCRLGIPGGLSDVPRLRAAAASMYLSIPVFADTPQLTFYGQMEGFTMQDLTCFKRVEYLRLEGIASVFFEAALRDDPSSDPLFPVCTKIVVSNFSFIRWPGSSVYGCSVFEDFADRLAEVLLRRCQCAQESVKIAFVGCNMYPATATLFKEKLGVNYTSFA